MTVPPPGTPAGYERVALRGATLVCRAALAAPLAAGLESHPTLWAYAAARPGRRELRGRAAAWAVALDEGTEVVVRHSWHGVLLAPLTRDLFVAPSRAPHELALAARLRAAGVRTPEVLAYALYPAPLGLVRADVVTRLVPGAQDLAAHVRTLPIARDPRGPWVEATGTLLHALARLGVRHPDLNLKNVLVTPAADGDGALDAWALDLDVAHAPAEPPSEGRARATGEANLRRLERSLEKWRARRGLAVSELELECLRLVARHGPGARVDLVWRPGHNVGTT
ncbi:lipopolysaccharide kinase InaA family protein [Roseisolibacter sp. H3M3-2]|uniref:lipopolysaccharide kinase InaA family protein n=1 Tax=Roseisolibacter sp. H3M3-2 TaxID=3031323 RepID=UPI0023DAD0FE|nr:lipopolysaccharide kinase InaA family protein [Roseisolibacter sp. H3M3-2]MDF1501575.1 lipopolysaccharide kinase InaA family protein [Roseisolibacter sp. H3M3-2]